jgi:hypothetical protein
MIAAITSICIDFTTVSLGAFFERYPAAGFVSHDSQAGATPAAAATTEAAAEEAAAAAAVAMWEGALTWNVTRRGRVRESAAPALMMAAAVVVVPCFCCWIT